MVKIGETSMTNRGGKMETIKNIWAEAKAKPKVSIAVAVVLVIFIIAAL